MFTKEETRLEDAIQSMLASNPSLKDADITVDAEDGTVKLGGVADSQSQIMAIMSAVRTMPGVTHIENEIRVRGVGSQTAGEYVDDTAITAAVKAMLLKEHGLSSLKIHVETKDGIVVLTGETDSEEYASRAENVAKSCNGVVEVRNLIEKVTA